MSLSIEEKKQRKAIANLTWKASHPGYGTERCRKYRKDNPDKYAQEKERSNEKARQARIQIFELLGNVCRKCGYSDSRALQIDHVENDGFKERSVSGQNYYPRMLRHPDFLSRYQILCANCNWIKRFENRKNCC